MQLSNPISHVTFPKRGIASTIATGSEGRIEVGITGREGMVGSTCRPGDRPQPPRHDHPTCRRRASRPIGRFQGRAESKSSMQRLLMRYAHVAMIQTAQTAHANAGFDIEARLARWLLMTHDRVEEA